MNGFITFSNNIIWTKAISKYMMTSSNGNIFALLALCAGNSPVTGEFPAQRQVTRSFDVFFDLGLNKRLSKRREAGDLRRHRAHYDVTIMFIFRTLLYCFTASLQSPCGIQIVAARAVLGIVTSGLMIFFRLTL